MNLFIFEYKFQMSNPIQQRYINALVVDDHSFFRKGLVSVLETIRYINKVDEASNGLEALSLLEKEKYEVVFMDFEMPEMNGEQTSQFITEKHPGTNVIAVSFHDDSFTIRKMFLAGCSGYIIKGENDEEITAAITTVLSGKKYFKGLIAEKLACESEAECYIRLHKQFTLNENEFEIIKLLCLKFNVNQIADKLNMQQHKVEKLRSSAQHKIGVKSPIELVYFAVRHRIIESIHFYMLLYFAG